MRLAYDLTMAAKAIPSGKYKTFVNAVKKFESVISVSLDLSAARESSERLIKLANGSNPEESNVLGDALLMHASIVYCRATHTKSSIRFHVGVDKPYTNEQKKKHEAIIELRNKCLAHFGPGEERWHDERAVAFQNGIKSGFTVVHHRVGFDTKYAEYIKELVQASTLHMKNLAEERASELDAALFHNWEDLREFVEAHRFDPDIFYADNKESAADFWTPTRYSHTLSLRYNDRGRFQIVHQPANTTEMVTKLSATEALPGS
jgi:hypothetical protein